MGGGARGERNFTIHVLTVILQSDPEGAGGEVPWKLPRDAFIINSDKSRGNKTIEEVTLFITYNE